MVYLLIVFPLAMTAAAFAFPSNRWRPWLLPIGALAQLIFVMVAVFQPSERGPVSGLSDWLLLDPLGKVVLGFVTFLFFLCALYAPGYLGAACRSAEPHFMCQPVRFVGHDDLGDAVAPLGVDVGGDGGHHAGQRSVDLFQPQCTRSWRRPGSIC